MADRALDVCGPAGVRPGTKMRKALDLGAHPGPLTPEVTAANQPRSAYAARTMGLFDF